MDATPEAVSKKRAAAVHYTQPTRVRVPGGAAPAAFIP